MSDLEVFERHVSAFMDALDKAGVPHGREVDISDFFFRYTLDAATDFLLGKSVDSLQSPKQDFAEAFAEVQRVQNLIARAGYNLPFYATSISPPVRMQV